MTRPLRVFTLIEVAVIGPAAFALLFSAAFFTGSAGCLLIARRASPLERRALAATIATLAAVAALGIALRDIDLDRIDWTAPGTIIWYAAAACLLALALALALRRRA